MKKLAALSLLFSFSAFANSAELENQKNKILDIIKKNEQSVNIALKAVENDRQFLRTSFNTTPALKDIQNGCADSEFVKLSENLKRVWMSDYVTWPMRRLNSSYQYYLNNPQVTPNLSISQSEIFDAVKGLVQARSIKVCKYNDLFIFEENEDFRHAKNGAWQNYNASLSFDDIKSGTYDKTLRHVVYQGPIKVEGTLTRFGTPSSSYRFGKVNISINWDKVPSGGYSFSHPELTNPLDIIKKAKKL